MASRMNTLNFQNENRLNHALISCLCIQLITKKMYILSTIPCIVYIFMKSWKEIYFVHILYTHIFYWLVLRVRHICVCNSKPISKKSQENYYTYESQVGGHVQQTIQFALVDLNLDSHWVPLVQHRTLDMQRGTCIKSHIIIRRRMHLKTTWQFQSCP